ncbi:MAG: hypothetical protein ACE5G1_16055, partial [bacterium]
MMRSLLVVFLFLVHSLFAQNAHNTALIGNLNYGRFTNDVWGYTDEAGNDYAIVGLIDGVSVVKVESEQLAEIAFVPGISSVWRDMKTHGHYVYVTNETGKGLDIIDLSALPDSVRLAGSYTKSFTTAHNLYIDNGHAY